ncbi:36006_t:CDS:2, partial [Gigaspora margarita]
NEKNKNVEEDPLDPIPNNFGDVMSLRETNISLPNEFNGLERICLTANGNLQRILSSWFNKSVIVQIIKNVSVPICHQKSSAHSNPILQKFDREVNLICEGKIVCNAISEVIIYDSFVVDLIMNKGVGIGQLFRYLDKLPSFQLHFVGRTANTWWREYTLKITGVECKIKEYFPNGMFDNRWIEIESNICNNEKAENQVWSID